MKTKGERDFMYKPVIREGETKPDMFIASCDEALWKNLQAELGDVYNFVFPEDENG